MDTDQRTSKLCFQRFFFSLSGCCHCPRNKSVGAQRITPPPARNLPDSCWQTGTFDHHTCRMQRSLKLSVFFKHRTPLPHPSFHFTSSTPPSLSTVSLSLLLLGNSADCLCGRSASSARQKHWQRRGTVTVTIQLRTRGPCCTLWAFCAHVWGLAHRCVALHRNRLSLAQTIQISFQFYMGATEGVLQDSVAAAKHRTDAP